MTVVRADVLAGLGGDLGALGPADLVVHRRGHAQPGLRVWCTSVAPAVVAAVLLGDQRVDAARPRPGGRRRRSWQLLVGHQLGLHDDQRGWSTTSTS